MSDRRPVKKTDWHSKACDVCGSKRLRSLRTRSYLWPTRRFHYEMLMHDARCETCGFIFEEKIPDQQFLERFYADGFSLESKSAEILPNYDAAKRLRLIKRFLNPRASVLEVGANRGDFCRTLQENGFLATGLDPLDKASKEVVQAAFVSSGFTPKSTYDAVVAYYVLEHVADSKEWLLAIAQSLKANGLLFIEVPDFEKYPLVSMNQEHLLHFTPYHLRRLLESTGYSVLELDTKTASLYFGFAVAARKIPASTVSIPISSEPMPDTSAIYERAIKEHTEGIRREQSVVDDILQRIEQDRLGGDEAKVVFWGANEIATSIAVLFSEKSAIHPIIMDNSAQKKGLDHPGFARPVLGPEREHFGTIKNIFVLCSPSWNAEIQRQIMEMNLPGCIFIDITKKGIGVAKRQLTA